MNQDEFIKEYEKNIQYLKQIVPPDDIYDYAEQTFMTALYFLHQYSKRVDLPVQVQLDPILEKYTRNILSFLDLRDQGVIYQINLNLLTPDE